MASIRYRSPWRVSVTALPELERRFASKAQAQTYLQELSAMGHGAVRNAQDRDGTWEARVRRLGSPDLVKTFETKRAAQDWAAAREGEIAKRQFIDYREAERHTVGEVLKRYEDEIILPEEKGSPVYYRVRKLQREAIAQLRLGELQAGDVQRYMQLLQGRGHRPATIIKQLDLLSLVIETARFLWRMPLPINPASGKVVKRPKLDQDSERDRTLADQHLQPDAEEVGRNVARAWGTVRLGRYEQRLQKVHARGLRLRFHPAVSWLFTESSSEECALLRAARYPHWYRQFALAEGDVPKPLVVPGRTARERGPVTRIWAVLSFAIETAMRRGELAKLTWDHVFLDEGYLHLPGKITKNKRPRVVPLSVRAHRILLTQEHSGERVFDTTVGALKGAYKQVFARCGVKDLRFHDLRHEATTRLVHNTTIPGLLIGQITGHRDHRMLQRYYNPKPADIVKLYRSSGR